MRNGLDTYHVHVTHAQQFYFQFHPVSQLVTSSTKSRHFSAETKMGLESGHPCETCQSVLANHISGVDLLELDWPHFL